MVSSSINVLPDGTGVQATCSTIPEDDPDFWYAPDWQTPVSYYAFTAMCSVKTPSGVVECPGDASFPPQGVSGCSWTLPLQPGGQYEIDSQHLIWFWSFFGGYGEPAGCPTYVPVNYVWYECGPPFLDFQMYTTVPVQNVPIAHLQTGQTLPIPSAFLNPPVDLYASSNSYVVATTGANFTAMNVAPATASLAQTQSATFQAVNIPGATIDWCLWTVAAPCGARPPVGQGTLVASGGSVTYTAPNTVVPDSGGVSATVYVCATEDGNPENYACAKIEVASNALGAVITDTSDIMDGNVTVNLTAPSGTTGDLNLDFNGTDATNMLELSQAPFPALSPGEQELQLPFDTILPGIYTMANGIWDALVPGAAAAQSVTVPDYTLPTPWTYFRKIRFTQYNKPHESACSGGDADAWLVDSNCNFTKIRLKAAFIRSAWLNGTGVTDEMPSRILQNAWALKLGDRGKGQECVGKYPEGAIGHTENDGNTFEVVSSVTGGCPHQTLVEDQTLAMPCLTTKTSTGRTICPASILSGVQTLSCGDDLNLDNGDHTTVFTRTVADLCPKCSNQSTFTDGTQTGDGHIDAFSSNTSCTGKKVKDLGFFYTSYPTN